VSEIKIFKDVIVPGTEFVVLERVLLSFRSIGEVANDLYWRSVEFSSSTPVVRGVRTWFRTVGSDGVSRYISLDPGEYRISAPKPPDIIIDIPVGHPSHSVREVLVAARDACRRAGPLDEREQKLIEITDRILTHDTDSLPEADAGCGFYKALKSQSSQQFQEFLTEIIQKQLANLENTFEKSGQGLALLRLQTMLGLHIEDRWMTDPGSYLGGFVNQFCNDEATRPQMLDAISTVCNNEYEDGNQQLRNALDAKFLRQMTFHLALSHLHLSIAWNAFKACPDLLKGKLNLVRPPVILEEAHVCVLSGITTFARSFCVKDYESSARELLAQCGPDMNALSKAARQDASQILPVFSKAFAAILSAQAMTLADDAQSIKVGIAEREKHRQLYPGGEAERGWIDLALLRAHKKIGDETAARSYAIHVAAQIFTRRSLGG
jgi:hypothetical protein